MKAESSTKSVEGRTHYRWVVLALIFVMYTIAFADRANVGIALPHIKQEFSLSNTEVGLIASLFSFSYAACQFPAALLVRKFGVRKSVPIMMGLTSLVGAAGGFAQSAITLQLSRLLLGVTESPLGLAMLSAINSWFPPREKGTAAGVFSASTKFAPVLVPPLGALIIAAFGWRYVFYAFAIPGLVAALLWRALVPDRPSESRHVNDAERRHIEAKEPIIGQNVKARAASPALDRLIRAKLLPRIETVKGILTSGTIWGSAICYLLVQSVVGVILFLLPLYLSETKGLSVMNVGLVSAAPFAGAVLGNLLGGLVSDRLLAGRRKPMMMLTFAATACSMYVLSSAPDAVLPLAAILFVTGVLLAVGYSPYSVFAAPMTTPQTFPVAVSVINTMGQIGTALAPLVTGMVLDKSGWPTVFVGLSVVSVIGLLVLTMVPEPLVDDEPQTA